jgi:hypothetical protein
VRSDFIVGQGLGREAGDGVSGASNERGSLAMRYIPAIIVIMEAAEILLVPLNRIRIQKINIRGLR